MPFQIFVQFQCYLLGANNGTSHNPEEEASEEDMALAVKVIEPIF